MDVLIRSLPNPSGFNPVLQCLSFIDCFGSSIGNPVVDSSLAQRPLISRLVATHHHAIDFEYQKPLTDRKVL